MSKKDAFNCKATADGGLLFTDYNRARLKQWLKDNAGIWLQLKPLRDESNKMRRFFEGGVVPLFCYYNETLNYHNSEDLEIAREWLKLEYNGTLAVINGKSHLISRSTKGSEVLPDFIERVIAGMEEQGMQTELLNPETYKHWRDTIFPFSEIENYIDYLISIKRLK